MASRLVTKRGLGLGATSRPARRRGWATSRRTVLTGAGRQAPAPSRQTTASQIVALRPDVFTRVLECNRRSRTVQACARVEQLTRTQPASFIGRSALLRQIAHHALCDEPGQNSRDDVKGPQRALR